MKQVTSLSKRNNNNEIESGDFWVLILRNHNKGNDSGERTPDKTGAVEGVVQVNECQPK